jgi:hypothetical protein
VLRERPTLSFHTVPAMLLDWYMRFRGIDEWPVAEATIETTEFIEGESGAEGKNPDGNRIGFTYFDASGVTRHGEVLALEGTDAFPLHPGDEFKVRFHPDRGERYFVEGVHQDPGFILPSILLVFFLFGAFELVRFLVHFWKAHFNGGVSWTL